MIVVKMMKGAKIMMPKHLLYLEKERNVEPEITHNKTVSKNKSSPSKDFEKKVAETKSDVDLESENYLKKEKSEIKYSGEFRRELSQYGFNDMSSEEKLKCVNSAWNDRISKYRHNIPPNGVGLRHFIISPNPKELSKLSDKDSREILGKTVKDSMRKFSERYVEKWDSLSYCYSIHTDKDHLHAHVYMHPLTKNGEYVSMNAARYCNKEQILKTGRTERKSKTLKPENKLNSYKKMTENSYRKELRRVLDRNQKLDLTQKRVHAVSKNLATQKIMGIGFANTISRTLRKVAQKAQEKDKNKSRGLDR